MYIEELELITKNDKLRQDVEELSAKWIEIFEPENYSKRKENYSLERIELQIISTRYNIHQKYIKTYLYQDIKLNPIIKEHFNWGTTHGLWTDDANLRSSIAGIFPMNTDNIKLAYKEVVYDVINYLQDNQKYLPKNTQDYIKAHKKKLSGGIVLEDLTNEFNKKTFKISLNKEFNAFYFKYLIDKYTNGKAKDQSITSKMVNLINLHEAIEQTYDNNNIRVREVEERLIDSLIFLMRINMSVYGIKFDYKAIIEILKQKKSLLSNIIKICNKENFIDTQVLKYLLLITNNQKDIDTMLKRLEVKKLEFVFSKYELGNKEIASTEDIYEKSIITIDFL